MTTSFFVIAKCLIGYCLLEGTFWKRQKIRTLILAELPKLTEKWQPCMNKIDEMTNKHNKIKTESESNKKYCS